MSLSLQCSTVIEELATDNCTTKRRISLRESQVSAVRNDLGQIVIRVTPMDKRASRKMIQKSLGYPVVQLDLYKKFLSQGMATISLPIHFVRLMLSNCPPDKLRLFLGTLRVKLKIQQNKLLNRPHLSDTQPTALSLLEEISPLRIPREQPELNNKKVFSCDISMIPLNPAYQSPPTSPDHNKFDTTGPKISTPIRKIKPKLSSNILARSFSHVNPEWNSNQINYNDPGRKQQALVIKFVQKGHNLFCTGGAGTGKSHLIKLIVGMLPPEYTAVTASTGSAANLIGGLTVHAFSGMGSLLESNFDHKNIEQSNNWIQSVRKRLLMRTDLITKWQKLRYLIVDEISMLSARLFTRLELIAIEARKLANKIEVCKMNKSAFDGIQLLVFGDFFQLPPVIQSSGDSGRKFAFQSPTWSKCKFRVVELSHSWRQSDDPQFSRLLSVIREGKCPGWAIELLHSRYLPLEDNTNVKLGKYEMIPTRLCTHRSDAEAWNQRMLNNLPGACKTYHAQDSCTGKTNVLNTICPSPSIMHLKVGAQVMLLRNLDTSKGLVNGARGIVEKINAESGLPEVRFFSVSTNQKMSNSNAVLHTIHPEKWNVYEDQNRIESRRQLPLTLAWAVSIHKSQGITLDNAVLSLSKVFECGQAYVALSRCRTLNSLKLLDWRPEAIRADPDVIKFYDQIRQINKHIKDD